MQPGTIINTGNLFERLDALGSWVAVYLTLKNVGSQNYAINQWDFELRVASPPSTYKVTDESLGMSLCCSGMACRPWESKFRQA
jgi:hypothetical protein